jgi:hypothetical protein
VNKIVNYAQCTQLIVDYIVGHGLDAFTPKGRHYYLQTQSLNGLQTETIEALIEQGLPLPSPYRFTGLCPIPDAFDLSENLFI